MNKITKFFSISKVILEFPKNNQKYRVPSKKIKYFSGYAVLQVEPFPRYVLLQICCEINNKLQQLPEDNVYRMYQEDKISYIADLCEQIEDISELEKEIGTDSVELFIQSFKHEIDLVDEMAQMKPWDEKVDPNHEQLKLGEQHQEDKEFKPIFVKEMNELINAKEQIDNQEQYIEGQGNEFIRNQFKEKKQI